MKSLWVHKGALLAVALLFCLLPAGLYAAGVSYKAKVRFVIDGDTVVLENGKHVRLIGINTPEMGGKRRRAEPLAVDARDQLRKWVQGQEVWLFPGEEERDRHGRLLAHIELAKGDSVQEKLLRQGLASVAVHPPNLSRVRLYHQAEKQARNARIGIWGHSYFAPIRANRLRWRDTGFRFVFGRVTRAGRGRNAVFITLERRVTIIIPKRYWSHWRDLNPARFRRHSIFVRGWLTRKRGRYRMVIRHPSMLEFPG